MEEFGKASTPQLMLDIIFEAFRIRDEKLNALAAEICARLGELPCERLLLEALKRKKQPAHCARLLNALKPIANHLDVSDRMVLTPLIFNKNEKIRQAAADLATAWGGMGGQCQFQVPSDFEGGGELVRHDLCPPRQRPVRVDGT